MKEFVELSSCIAKKKFHQVLCAFQKISTEILSKEGPAEKSTYNLWWDLFISLLLLFLERNYWKHHIIHPQYTFEELFINIFSSGYFLISVIGGSQIWVSEDVKWSPKNTSPFDLGQSPLTQASVACHGWGWRFSSSVVPYLHHFSVWSRCARNSFLLFIVECGYWVSGLVSASINFLGLV